MSNISSIDKEIKATRSELAEAQGVYRDLSLQLVESPGSKKVQDGLATTEREIEVAERKLARLEAARAEAEHRNTEAAKRAELEGLKKMQVAVRDRMERMSVVADKLVEQIIGIAPLAAEYRALAEENRTAAWSIVRGALGGDVNKVQHYFNPISDSVRGNGVVPFIIDCLESCGLTRAFKLTPHVDVRAVGHSLHFGETMVRERERVLNTLASLIERREAELSAELTEQRTARQQ